MSLNKQVLDAKHHWKAQLQGQTRYFNIGTYGNPCQIFFQEVEAILTLWHRRCVKKAVSLNTGTNQNAEMDQISYD